MVAVRKVCLLLASLCLAVPVGSASQARRALVDAAPSETTLAHYNHRAWRMVDGAPPEIWALVQAPDGFLWLGTGSGIYRFDGMVFEEVMPRSGQFPSSNATALFITPDGTTWIGFFTGEISRLNAGRLQSFDHSDSAVEQFAQDREGTMWAARSGQRGGLFKFDGARWSRVAGQDGITDSMAYSVIAAHDGAVWVATDKHILVRRPGGRRFEAVRNIAGVARLAQAPNGQVWVSGDLRPTNRAAMAEHRLAVVPHSSTRAERADRMIFSRDGALWQTTFGGGVTRIDGLSRPGMAPRIERFSTEEGLTSPVAVPVLQDREGNIWIGTNLGLNRLRPVSAVTALRVDSGLTRTFALAATSDGPVYVANAQNLYRALPGGTLELFRTLPKPIEFLEADGKDLIIGQGRSVLRLTKGQEHRIDIPAPPGEIESWSSPADGDTWITAKEAGAFRSTSDGWRAAEVAEQGLARSFVFSHVRTTSADWLYAQDLLLRRNDRQFAGVAPHGPGLGHITLVSEGHAGLLVGGELGLARLRGEHFQTLGTARAPMLRGISGIVQTPSCEVWINGVRGLLRTTCDDLDVAFADQGEPFRYQRFSAADGLPGVAQQNGAGSSLVRGGDGRIWFANNIGIGWLDPSRLVTNRLPPPVEIRSLEANGRLFTDVERVALPAGTQNLRIDYTALSLAAAEMLQFRYRLIGVDRDWVDAGARREAFYTNLPPGEWRFQVIAANNDGVWNTQGDSLTISIAPWYYQTNWFRLLCICLLFIAAWLIYNWRVSEHRRRERDRAEIQLAERERIARELHDTLLQGVQGLMLRFQAAANVMTPGSREHRLAEKALERADDLVIQARDRVRDLRAMDRPIEFRTLLQELAEQYRRDGLSISLISDEQVGPLAPEAAEHLLRIVAEALANTLRHAKASEVVIRVGRDETRLQLSITDNGIGFPVEVITNKGRPGHFGVQGMCERAYALGGTLYMKNSADGGARIELRVPLAD